MPLYQYADRVLQSQIGLGELAQPGAAGSVDGPDLTFTQLTEPPAEPRADAWVHRWSSGTPGGPVAALAVGRTRGGFLLRFQGFADFAISGDGRTVGAWVLPGTAAETLTHLLLDQVLPRVLAQQSRLVLHASAVRVRDAIVAFLGESGGGKSTLAASLDAAGCPALADDGLVVEPGAGHAIALPTYTGLRLWPASADALISDGRSLSPMAHYSTKKRVVMGGAPVQQPLAAIYVLAALDRGRVPGAQAVTTTRVSQRDACMALITHAFRLDVTDERQTAAQFDLASRIAAQLPVFTLTYPRDFSRLADVHAEVLKTSAAEP